MFSHLCLLLNWLLSRPIVLCITLFAFLIMILSLIHQEIHIDTDGVPLSSRKVKIQPMSKNMRELLELSRHTGWKKDPKVKARVIQLSKSVEDNKPILETPEKKPKAVLPDPDD